MSMRHWRERDHPRNPKNGRFVEKGTGQVEAWAERISDSIGSRGGSAPGGGDKPYDPHAEERARVRAKLEQDPRDRRTEDAGPKKRVRELRSSMLFEVNHDFSDLSDQDLQDLVDYMGRDPRADRLADLSKAAVKAEQKRRRKAGGVAGGAPADPSGFDALPDELGGEPGEKAITTHTLALEAEKWGGGDFEVFNPETGDWEVLTNESESVGAGRGGVEGSTGFIATDKGGFYFTSEPDPEDYDSDEEYEQALLDYENDPAGEARIRRRR